MINDKPLNSLSWADDLIVFATKKEGLQNCLVKLENYCNKWDLTINTDKTKTMTCSKGQIQQELFLYKDSVLESVKQFKYLGIIIQSNGHFKKAIQDRCMKSRRALYALKRALSTSSNVSVKLAMSLYDKQISPILLYGCPVWGSPPCTNYIYIDDVPENVSPHAALKSLDDSCKVHFCKRVGRVKEGNTRPILVNVVDTQAKYRILDRNNSLASPYRTRNYVKEQTYEYENIHNEVCKYALNVNKFVSNTACRLELGRYPVHITVLSLCAKYWATLENGLSKNKLLLDAYEMCKNQNQTWIQGIRQILRLNGLGTLVEDRKTNSPKRIQTIVSQRLKDKYRQQLAQKAQSNSNLQTLYDIKESYEMSDYLVQISNLNARRNLTKIRLGLTTRRQVDKVCPLCNSPNIASSASHLLWNCPALSSHRDQFMKNAKSINPSFCNASVKTQVFKVMNVVNEENIFCRNVISYINAIYDQLNPGKMMYDSLCQ